jgi:hypothetical protein
MLLNISIYGAFVIIVVCLGFFLWKVLFVSEEVRDGRKQTEPAYSEQQTDPEQPLRGGPIPSSSENAITEYTKWLAIFTLFLVLATIALFISGERNVDVARKSAVAAGEAARAAKNSVELAKNTAERQLRAYGDLDLSREPNAGGRDCRFLNG